MDKVLKTAFTLIELLVVIAIIGILSGLIVVTMNGVTQKANIAKGQIFSNSLRNALMANLVAEYKLDGNFNDSWGGLNGTVNSSPASSTSCVYGSCYSFDGSDDYVNLNSDPVFDNMAAITIIAWVNPGIQDSQRFISKNTSPGVGGWDLRMRQSSSLWFTVDYSGASLHRRGSTQITSDGKWKMVAVTWNGSSLYTDIHLYVNGVEEATTEYSSASGSREDDSGNNVLLGTSGGVTGYCYKGLMDDVRIYNAAIPTSQIKEQYYTGLNNLFLNGGITKEEYLSRINDYAINN
ncbi:MAG: prepilin-type N-terminal cleavage/methylation domain-containing protein [Candidatus Pacebacteria bacterium]|nr:prepilin-type N-terminal cleavage/methylation domain-containing protein [Candidatus Paceibacterota bacterium]